MYGIKEKTDEIVRNKSDSSFGIQVLFPVQSGFIAHIGCAVSGVLLLFVLKGRRVIGLCIAAEQQFALVAFFYE